MKATEAQALARFAALSQETRLRIVRLLVVAGEAGMAAGVLAARLDASASRLSFHLTHLEHAGLVTSRRDGRSIIYCAVYPALTALVEFLNHDCCRGIEDNTHVSC